eukprot:gene24500-14047_t
MPARLETSPETSYGRYDLKIKNLKLEKGTLQAKLDQAREATLQGEADKAALQGELGQAREALDQAREATLQ